MASWQKTIPLMVRHLIDDLDDCIDDRRYSEERVTQAVAIAGILVDQEYDFATTYVFDICIPDITPDPVVEGDNIAVALMSLKTACILTMNDYQQATQDGSGLKVKDGDSMVDMTGNFKGYKDIVAFGPCKSYDKLLKDLETKKSMGRGKAVLTPMVHDDFSPTGLDFGLSVSRFFDDFRTLVG